MADDWDSAVGTWDTDPAIWDLPPGTVVNVTGLQVTVSVGSVTVVAKASAAVTNASQVMTAAVGTVVASVKGNVLATGPPAMTASVGTATPYYAWSEFAVGNAMTAAVGTAAVAIGQRVNVTMTGLKLGSVADNGKTQITNSTSFSMATTTNVALNMPGFVGDLEVMVLFIRPASGTGTPPAVTPPAGWTQLWSPTSQNDGTQTGTLYGWTKRYLETDSITQTWTHTSAIVVATMSAVIGGAGVDAQSHGQGAASTSTAPSITTTQYPNEVALYVMHDWHTTQNVRTPPTGYTEQNDQILYVANSNLTALGATGSVSMFNQNTTGEPYQANLIAFYPVAVSVIGKAVVAIDGSTLGMTAYVGIVSTGGGIVVGVTSPAMTASVGTVTVNAKTNISVTGVFMNVTGAKTVIAGSGASQPWGSHTAVQFTNTGNALSDMMIAVTVTRNTTASSITPPSGWTLLIGPTDITDGTNISRYYVWWKKWQSSDPNPWVFNQSIACSSGGFTYSYTGTRSPPDVWSINTGTGTTSTALSVTPTKRPDELILFLAHDWNTGTGLRTPPSGYTERFDTAFYYAESNLLSQNPTGDIVVTNANASGTDPWLAAIVLLATEGVDVSLRMTVNATSPAMTASVGTVSAGVLMTVPVTGQAVTASVGTVTVIGKASVTISGLSVTTSVGTVTVNYAWKEFAVGNQATVSVGTATGSGAQPVSVSVTGLALTASVGSVSISLPWQQPVTGQFMVASVGSVTVNAAVGVGVTGQVMTASVGTVSIVGKVNLPVTGQQVAVSVGTVTVTGKANVALTAPGMTAAVGTVAVGLGSKISIDGSTLGMTASTNSVFAGVSVTINVTGLELDMRSMGAVFVGGSGVAQPKPPDKEGRMLQMTNWMGS